MTRETKRFLGALLLAAVLIFTVLQPRHFASGLAPYLIAPHLPLWLNNTLTVFAVFSLAWAIANGFELFLWRRLYGESLSGMPRQRKLFTDLFNAGLYVVAAGIIAVEVFDQTPTGLFATSGVIAIILGFALQQLLADIFAGVALNLERPFKAGDWISVDGTNGLVLMTNWRSTHLRTRNLDRLVVPNAVIGRAKLVNHSQPQPRHLDSVELALWYGFDETEAQKLLGDAARGVPGVLADPAPIILLHEMRSVVAVWRIYFFTEDFGRLIIIKGAILQAAYAALRGGALRAYLPRSETILQLDTGKLTGDAD